MRRVKCPKCRKPPEKYIEGWEAYITFFPDDEGFPEQEGLLGGGLPDGKVEAICSCGHRWTLRGISQITELQKPALSPSGEGEGGGR